MQENGFVTCQEIDKGISPRYNRTGNNWMESSEYQENSLNC